ncbi:tRNA wybutosine-synthesizing 3 -like protein [Brachionus plicatilis]|uniref:tRNA wybutosine-synthesizing protein 3 homolog n=1 Tax=Brachionus plicatilis TaxID=10195 RepID=A0A3M7RPA2_BRAPC|nr:tRNA wybutosine-synthesizing 3 -like protein [Brachionus plicatilis]
MNILSIIIFYVINEFLDEKLVKKNCQWIYVSHDPLSEDDIENFIDRIINHKSPEISIKFEPFILHVCCRNLDAAKLMLEKAVASGYRNSGLSLGSSKIILAVRSTQNLEIPIVVGGNLLVDKKYLRCICGLVGEKFSENFERIDRFLTNIESCLDLNTQERPKSKKELKALERLNKKLMYDKLKSNGVLTRLDEKESGHESDNSFEEIENLF